MNKTNKTSFSQQSASSGHGTMCYSGPCFGDIFHRHLPDSFMTWLGIFWCAHSSHSVAWWADGKLCDCLQTDIMTTCLLGLFFICFKVILWYEHRGNVCYFLFMTVIGNHLCLLHHGYLCFILIPVSWHAIFREFIVW